MMWQGSSRSYSPDAIPSAQLLLSPAAERLFIIVVPPVFFLRTAVRMHSWVLLLPMRPAKSIVIIASSSAIIKHRHYYRNWNNSLKFSHRIGLIVDHLQQWDSLWYKCYKDLLRWPFCRFNYSSQHRTVHLAPYTDRVTDEGSLLSMILIQCSKVTWE